MKRKSLPYVSILIYTLFGLFSLFLIPHSAVAQNADCDSANPHLNVPVYFYDQRGVKWGETGNACVTNQGANITRISGINNTYFTCSVNNGRVVGAFISRSYRCVAGTMIFDIQAPPNFDCSKSTWRYLEVGNGFDNPNNTESSAGSGCRVTVPYPPGDFQRQIIITINLPDPPRVSQTCNNNGTVTLQWNSVSGATEYAWRLNNRVNGWYTASTDLFGYTGSTSVNVPMQYGASYDWAVTATNSAGRHPFPSSWSAAFSCPALTPTPFINIQTRNAQGVLAPVQGIAYSYNCGSWPVCFRSILQNVSSGTINAYGGQQGGAGIALNTNQRLLGVTPAPAGGALNIRSNNRASPWWDNVTWNNYWWASYPTTGSRTVNFVVASITPTPTPTFTPTPTPPLSCGTVTVPSSPALVGAAYNARISGISITTTGCNLLFNAVSADTGTSTGTPRRCDMATTVRSGNVTYNVRATNGATSISCASGTFCGDSTAPPYSPTRTLTCSYAGIVAGIRRYNVAYTYNAVADVGCVGMSSTPYWAQLSGAATFATALNTDNTWQGGAAGLTTSAANVNEGTTVYAHVRSRDALNNQSIWSTPTNSRLLNPTNCTGVPTNTPTPTATNTPTPTPTATATPTPAYWYKLKDASLNKRVAANANVKVPNPALAYDADDTTAGQLVIGQAGVISSNYNLTPINGGTFSTNAWYKGSYALNNPYIQSAVTLNTFKDSLISSKDIKMMNTDSITQIEANKVNIRDPGNLTINTAIPNGPYVIFVNGNIYVNGPLPVFNSTSQSIALVATGSIFIHQNLTGANGIFIAPNIVLTSSGVIIPQQPPLKINGNIISTNQVITTIRQSTDQNRPSFFVVFKPKMYLDLLPLLSTVVTEGRQLE